MTDDKPMLDFDGDGETGDCGLPPRTGEALATFIQGASDTRFFHELRLRYQQRDEEHMGTREGERGEAMFSFEPETCPHRHSRKWNRR